MMDSGVNCQHDYALSNVRNAPHAGVRLPGTLDAEAVDSQRTATAVRRTGPREGAAPAPAGRARRSPRTLAEVAEVLNTVELQEAGYTDAVFKERVERVRNAAASQGTFVKTMEEHPELKDVRVAAAGTCLCPTCKSLTCMLNSIIARGGT